jgi:hypothetical protein
MSIHFFKNISENENIFYLDFITQKTNYNETALISQIHKYCVKESFEKTLLIISSFVL